MYNDVISDLDECHETPAVCSQVCINTEGNYTCKCNTGYLKTSSGRCKRIDSEWSLFSLLNWTFFYLFSSISVKKEDVFH